MKKKTAAFIATLFLMSIPFSAAYAGPAAGGIPDLRFYVRDAGAWLDKHIGVGQEAPNDKHRANKESKQSPGTMHQRVQADAVRTKEGKTLEEIRAELKGSNGNPEKQDRILAPVIEQCVGYAKDPHSIANALGLAGICAPLAKDYCDQERAKAPAKQDQDRIRSCDFAASDKAIDQESEENKNLAIANGDVCYRTVRHTYEMTNQSLRAQALMREADKRMQALQSPEAGRASENQRIAESKKCKDDPENAECLPLTRGEYVRVELSRIKQLREDAKAQNALTGKHMSKVSAEVAYCSPARIVQAAAKLQPEAGPTRARAGSLTNYPQEGSSALVGSAKE